ncbi:MAG: T9SS type A sorting domain-containing protein, partial [Bacteroidetes bacterium]|nr:T9SS type A sorting domain-containing protein [Bacteroidota bacterium]
KGQSVTGINNMYPNPCNDILNVNLKAVSEGDITIEVVDAFGKVQNSIGGDDITGLSTVSFDLSNLSTGVYFIKVSNSCGQSKMSKFVKK